MSTSDWFGLILASMGIGSLVGYTFAGTLKISGQKKAAMLIILLFIDVLGFAFLGLAKSPIHAVIITFCIGIVNGMININIIISQYPFCA